MNPYKCMYVIPKDKYKTLMSHSTTSPSNFTPEPSHSSREPSPSNTEPSPSSLSSVCHLCGRSFKHPNILAHHLKSHVNGYKCNICGKVFTHRRTLRKHLDSHGPQVPTVEAPGGPPTVVAPELRCHICNKKAKHKRNLARHIKTHSVTLKFQPKRWETLK